MVDGGWKPMGYLTMINTKIMFWNLIAGGGGEGWMKNVLGVKYQKITSSGDVYFGLDSKIPKIFSCKVFSNKS